MHRDACSANQENEAQTSHGGLTQSLAAGLAGAGTVTVINEIGRRLTPHAPRLDRIGERSLAVVLRLASVQPPRGGTLFALSIAADLVSNTAYYSVQVAGERPWLRGVALGLAAGIGAALLPQRMGLGQQPEAE